MIQIDLETLPHIVEEARSLTDFCRLLEIPYNDKVMLLIKALNLDTSHWVSRGYVRNISMDDVLIENCPFSNGYVRKRLLESGIIDYLCSECGTEPIWNNQPLTLQLHHKNGITSDNRLENICFLCPNCHSQTDNWCIKNR